MYRLCEGDIGNRQHTAPARLRGWVWPRALDLSEHEQSPEQAQLNEQTQLNDRTQLIPLDCVRPACLPACLLPAACLPPPASALRQ